MRIREEGEEEEDGVTVKTQYYYLVRERERGKGISVYGKGLWLALKLYKFYLRFSRYEAWQRWAWLQRWKVSPPSFPPSLTLPCLLYRDRRGGGRRPVRSYNDLDMPDDMY